MPRPSQIMSTQLCAIEVECARQETIWVIKNKRKCNSSMSKIFGDISKISKSEKKYLSDSHFVLAGGAEKGQSARDGAERVIRRRWSWCGSNHVWWNWVRRRGVVVSASIRRVHIRDFLFILKFQIYPFLECSLRKSLPSSISSACSHIPRWVLSAVVVWRS